MALKLLNIPKLSKTNSIETLHIPHYFKPNLAMNSRNKNIVNIREATMLQQFVQIKSKFQFQKSTQTLTLFLQFQAIFFYNMSNNVRR